MLETEGVLILKNKKGQLIGIVYNDLTKSKSQIFYKIEECGVEDIKDLLEQLTKNE